jgi:hypothetical protein
MANLWWQNEIKGLSNVLFVVKIVSIASLGLKLKI